MSQSLKCLFKPSSLHFCQQKVGAPNSNHLPVSSSGEICDFIHRDVLGHKSRDGVTDEHICLLDLAPQMIPDILLRSSLLVRQVASDLDVGSVQNWSIWSYQLDERDQTRHLRVVNLSRQYRWLNAFPDEIY